jgi:transposase-like protein
MRVKVLGGLERRRRWSQDDKARIVEETHNFSLLRRWFEEFLCVLLSIFRHSGTTPRPA